MQVHFRPIVACLAAGVLLAVAGCGGDGEANDPAPAAIGGPGHVKTGPEANSREAPQATSLNDSQHPVVVVETSLGEIRVELDAEKAPLTVDNFLWYVDQGRYDQTIFHQVYHEPPKLIIGGAYGADLKERKADASIRNEAHNRLKNLRGTIAMARRSDAIDSATRHFFFNVTDNEMLDHKDRSLEGYGYCVFGKVIEGLDVIDRISAVAVRDTDQFKQLPVETVMIKTIRRVR